MMVMVLFATASPSQVLDNFLAKLDKYFNAGSPKILAKERVYGDVIEKPASENVFSE